MDNSAKTPIILDCDPGHDDAIAMILAAKHPRIELLGITTVAGNQTIEKTTNNALKVLDFLGINIPVAQGAAKPLIAKQIIAEDIHGKTGLDGPIFPELQSKPVDKFAPDFIEELIAASKEEKVTLVPTGPLTNIAIFLQSKPWMIPKIQQIVLMGGAYGLGNVTPAAEFNILVDPEAARIVFQSGIPIVMMGLDLTRQALATKAIVEKINGIHNCAAKLFVDLIDFFARTQEKIFGWIEGPPVHDPTTIAYLIDPTLIELKSTFVTVDTSAGECYGRTVCDFFDTKGAKHNCLVATKLDFDRFWELMYNTIKLY